MHLGYWQLDTVSGGAFVIDGGAMFGVVPRTLWGNLAAPDELNRVRCANHCVLARNGRQTALLRRTSIWSYSAICISTMPAAARATIASGDW